MRAKVTSSVALASVCLATMGVLGWSRTAAGAPEARHPHTLRLTTETEQFAFLDHGRTGPSVGDQLVFSDRVHRDGVQIGPAASTCTIVRLASPTMTCQLVVAFALPQGQLTLQGIADGPDHPPAAGETSPFTLAVTGGTGTYRAA